MFQEAFEPIREINVYKFSEWKVDYLSNVWDVFGTRLRIAEGKIFSDSDMAREDGDEMSSVSGMFLLIIQH